MPTSSRAEAKPGGALPALRAALLVGGASSRMGTPKQLLAIEGETFAERIARTAERLTERLVICGAGELPAPLAGATRVADAAGVAGPLAGLLAAFAHDPESAWLALSCDQPLLTREALEWLAGERRSGAIAVMPRLVVDRVEPLPAIYEPAARSALAALAAKQGSARSLQRLADHPGVRTPQVPDELASAFAGANDPAELARLGPRGGPG